MKITSVVVGIDHWKDLTLPFVIDLKWYNPDVQIIVIDNASKEHYPETKGIDILRLDKRVGYSAALNFGARAADWDVLLCANNDCSCSGSVIQPMSKIDGLTIYGDNWKYEVEQWIPATLDSGYFIIPRNIWEVLGGFDELCEAAFEEIDYCLRALERGYNLDVMKLPIKHLNKHTRRESGDYDARWMHTYEYFCEKWHKYRERYNA